LERGRKLGRVWSRYMRMGFLVSMSTGSRLAVLCWVYCAVVVGVLEQAADEIDLKEEGGERVLEIFDPGSPAEAARLATLDGGIGALTINGAGPGVGAGNGPSTGESKQRCTTKPAC
jgi:hypothetical protein